VKLILCSFDGRLRFFNNPPYFLDFGSDATALLKTAIPFSVCVTLNFYNATFAEFSYTNVRRACNNYHRTTSSVTLWPNSTRIQWALIATVIS